MNDLIERIWHWLDDFDLKFLFKFLKDNIVGAAVVVTLLFWIPISCLISHVDRKRAEKDKEECEWQRTDQLIHPNDLRRIIHIRVPRRLRNSELQFGGQSNYGVSRPGLGCQPLLGGTNLQMHYDNVYEATKGDLHCSMNQ